MQFRAEYFNIFNHTNFGDPTTTLGGTLARSPALLRRTAPPPTILVSRSSR